jgi:signal transduction histidine kinase
MTRSASPRRDLHVLHLVAHELRAHLTVLNGYSSLLLEDPQVRGDPKRVERALREIRSHLATLTDMSSHIVELVQADDGPGLPMAVTDFDLAAAAREALAMTADLARRRGVGLGLDVHRLGRDPVHGDRFQLVTAMRNLIDNACTHGPAGADVVLEVGRSGGEVEVRARDRGSGLGSLGAAAFEPGRQGDRHGGQGMGVGLSLVAEVARAHSGEVTWQSWEGWSSVGLRFPDRAAA